MDNVDLGELLSYAVVHRAVWSRCYIDERDYPGFDQLLQSPGVDDDGGHAGYVESLFCVLFKFESVVVR